MDKRKLISLPETGMGYQVIDGKIQGKSYESYERYVVYNSELFVELDSNFKYYQQKIINRESSEVLEEAQPIPMDTSTISLVSKSLILEEPNSNYIKKNNKHRHSGGKGAMDTIKIGVNGEDTFVRLSAYENDRRIDFENNKLREGSFTTTHLDYLHCIKFQDDPVDRYALPNDETIKWAFYLRPASNDNLQVGIVQPAFGHDGGGIEAYFEYGTSDNTYFDKKSYGN